jgi:hypothetical protein
VLIRALRAAAFNTVFMRFNPLALVFAPGIGLGGLLVGGMSGAQSALAAWLLIVGAATVWTLIRGPVDSHTGRL